MKLCSCSVSVLVLVGLFAVSTTSPTNGLARAYQQPSSLHYQSSTSPQQLVYLQYVQQPQSSQTFADLRNAAYEFVASEAIATGTQKDYDAKEMLASEVSVSSDEIENTDDDSTTEIPQDTATTDLPTVQENDQDGTTVADDLPVEEITVEYESEPTNSEPSDIAVTEGVEDDDEADTAADTIAARNANEVAPKSGRAPLPAGTFFPIQFKGPTKGGAIAIANSFSTGEGGSATSHAIAYGQPNGETT